VLECGLSKKSKTFNTYCEKVGRRGKDQEKKNFRTTSKKGKIIFL
jgi:hypothetical protein